MKKRDNRWLPKCKRRKHWTELKLNTEIVKSMGKACEHNKMSQELQGRAGKEGSQTFVEVFMIWSPRPKILQVLL